MRLADYPGTGDFFVHLTYEEEQILAQWTMDLLAYHGFVPAMGKVYRMVKELYLMKCERGTDFLATWLVELGDAVEKWNEKFELQLATHVFEFPDNGKERTAPIRNDGGKEYTREEQKKWICNDTRRAWREIWREHRLKTAQDGFLVFPGDEPDQTHTDLQVEREVRFWGEVGRRQKEYGVSRDQAILAVSDYMPRGEFPEGELEDPINDRSMLELMEVEYPDPPPPPDIDD